MYAKNDTNKAPEITTALPNPLKLIANRESKRKTSVTTHPTTQCYIPGDLNPHQYHSQDLIVTKMIMFERGRLMVMVSLNLLGQLCTAEVCTLKLCCTEDTGQV
jgi:hypothetical protein